MGAGPTKGRSAYGIRMNRENLIGEGTYYTVYKAQKRDN